MWLTPINWHLTAEEAAYIVDDSESHAGDRRSRAFEAVARAAAGDLPVLVAGDELDAALAAAGDEPFDADDVAGGVDALHQRHDRAAQGREAGHPVDGGRPGPPDPGRPARSSGSTAAGPHLVTGPLYHAAPLGYAVIDLQNGAPLVIMPRWDEQPGAAT